MQNRGLGKGLSSLIPGGAKPMGQETVLAVDIAAIQPNPHQPRKQFDEQALQELAESIRSQGVILPLVVRQTGAGYEIIAGERRWRAARIAGLETVPAMVRQATDAEMLQLALVENVQREDLNPIERALAYRRLIDQFGVTQEAIAAATGRSRASITNTLRLLKLPQEIQDRIASGALSEGHGRALLQVANEAERHMIWRRSEKDGLSVREAAQLVQRTTAHTAPGDSKPKKKAETEDTLEPFIEEMETALRTTLGTEVEISNLRSGAGTIRIRYYSSEDLERIARLISTFGSVPSASALGLTDPE